MPDGLTPDIALGYVTSLMQALKPFSYFAWVAAGALLFWFLPVGRRRYAPVGGRGSLQPPSASTSACTFCSG